MLIVSIAIAVAWSVMLGAAYLGRAILRLGKAKAAGLVAVAYVLCAVLTLSRLGIGMLGLLGITGLLLPCGAALLFAVL